MADVNRDGNLDFIVANGCANISVIYPGSGSICILLGNGHGTFQPVQTVPTGGVPYSVVIADVNRDGSPDVLVANQDGGNNGEGSVGVLLGEGNGSFQPVKIYSSGGLAAHFIAAADVNNDGEADLLVVNLAACNNCHGSVGVLLGNGDGTFQPVVTYGATSFASGVLVVDMNGDGKPDLVVNQGGEFGGGTVSILLGNGDGTFQPAATYYTDGLYNSLPVVADVNGDHKPDLLAPNGQFCAGHNSSFGCVAVLLGNGDGTLQTPITYGSGGGAARWLALADVDKDGKLDIAVVNECASAATCSANGGSVGVLLGNGDGTFQPAQTYGTGGSGSSWLMAVDLNSDNSPDLLVYNPNITQDSTLAVLLNNTSLCTTPPVIRVSASPTSLWPSNGKMVPVAVSGTITDTGYAVNVKSAAYVVQDEYGLVQPTGAITLDTGGRYSFTVMLQASRRGSDSDGRQYTITISAKDNAGHSASNAKVVTVPHDQGR